MPNMASEDFAFMLQAKACCYLWLGTQRGADTPTLHNPRFDFNDEVLSIGSRYFAEIVRQRLPLLK